MTGFARADGAGPGCRWSWELRSVNGKGLDLRFRGPPGFDDLEAALRERAAARFSRGTIQATLTLDREVAASTVTVNQQALDQLVAAAEAVRQRTGGPPVAVEQLLAVRGVVDIVEGEGERSEALVASLLVSLDEALEKLGAMRAAEGAAIGAMLELRLARIADLADEADANPARTAEAIRARLAEQVSTLLGAAPALDPARLHQEAVMLATRADIAEEIDRLRAHVIAARALLADGGPVGRKLDFLAQEFNRETNTLCAKANDKSLTATGLELKAVVDQLREQIQNLE
ncbi:MAG: YicC family protein [Bauldia sp.]|nr:YicC family protein [Bauldia sp.]